MRHQTVLARVAILACFALTAAPVFAQPTYGSGIGKGELPRLSEILTLTEAQASILEDFHSEYEVRVLAEYMPAYAAWRNTLYEVGNSEHVLLNRIDEGEVLPEEVPDLSKEFQEAYGLLTPANKILHEIDEWFFSDIEAMLTDDQMAQMEHLRLYRERTIYRNTLASLSESDIDLIELVRALQPSLSVDEAAALAEWELRYGHQLAHCLRALSESWPRWRASVDESHYYIYMSMAERARANVEKRSPDALKIHEWTEKQKELSERGGRLAIQYYRAIVTLNRAELRFLLDFLPPPDAQRLHDLYRRTAYPGVYPDPGTAEKLYEVALAIEGLSNEQIQAVAALRDAFLREHERFSELMANSIYDRTERNLNQAHGRKTVGEHWADLRDYSDRRHALNRAQRDRLSSILTPEQIAKLPEGMWDDPNPPRPWDPTDVTERDR